LPTDLYNLKYDQQVTTLAATINNRLLYLQTLQYNTLTGVFILFFILKYIG